MPRDVLETIEAAQAAARRLEDRTREAHAATKDLRRAMAEHAELVRTTVREEIDATMRSAANDAFKGMAHDVEVVAKGIEEALRRRLEALYDLYLVGEEGSPEAFHVLMERRQSVRQGIAQAEADRAASGRPPEGHHGQPRTLPPAWHPGPVEDCQVCQPG